MRSAKYRNYLNLTVVWADSNMEFVLYKSYIIIDYFDKMKLMFENKRASDLLLETRCSHDNLS